VVEDDPLYLGNPTNAQNSTAYPENYLKNSVYYKIAYSRSRSIPVWVAWHLQSEDQGGIPRQDDFRADTELPSGWYQVQSNSFSGSGFDRGHNCPSADRTRSVAANSSTFLMTNMIPQSPNLNQGPWEGLEDYIRNSLLGTTNEAYVYMGNFGSGGYNSSNSLYTTINNGNVVVPAKVWKVVVVLPKGSNDKARLSSNTIVLAVDMPNDNRLYTTSNKTAWRNYLCTVSSLEAEASSTGVPLNLFQDVVDSLRPVLKAKLFQ
jgi:endonuclease G